ncbi:ferric reductase transmembrane component [Colletotrichum tofieldiae]|nr:ferric reductase transmembrane component [Colletotrichum tofieldiae]GKT78468.1 ferric reductase transmembrane component [Colletotrichum tofieldiae]GKT85832.1 ferric reductase transmembrane component [Colletotrichum tofieldiae]
MLTETSITRKTSAGSTQSTAAAGSFKDQFMAFQGSLVDPLQDSGYHSVIVDRDHEERSEEVASNSAELMGTKCYFPEADLAGVGYHVSQELGNKISDVGLDPYDNAWEEFVDFGSLDTGVA